MIKNKRINNCKNNKIGGLKKLKDIEIEYKNRKIRIRKIKNQKGIKVDSILKSKRYKS